MIYLLHYSWPPNVDRTLKHLENVCVSLDTRARVCVCVCVDSSYTLCLFCFCLCEFSVDLALRDVMKGSLTS